MASQVPELFDPVKVLHAADRAQQIGIETFLLERAADDLVERLAPVMRDFETILDLGTHQGAFGAALVAAGRAQGAETIPLAGDAPLRPLGPGTASLVLSGLVLHRVNDLPGLLARIRQALMPDGLFLAAFPGGETLMELRDVLVTAESEIRGAAGLRVFPMIDVLAAGQLLQRAGFALPVADSERLTLRYDHLLALVRDLRAMGATASQLVRPGQPALTRAIIARAAALYAERHADADGRIRATIEIVWMSGWAPHASQQQPLRPGSAKMRLAEALAGMRKDEG